MVMNQFPRLQSPFPKSKIPLWSLLVVSLASTSLLYSPGLIADTRAPLVEELWEIEKFPWTSASFALGATLIHQLWGQLYKPSKAVFVSTILLFEIGSVVCGCARTLGMLIVGKFLCGVGGSGLFLCKTTAVSFLTTSAERVLYLSFPGIAWYTGAV